jgi:serine/threonine protein kinase
MSEEKLMSDSSPVIETWIDRIATEFDRAWHEGRRPRIEDYLGQAAGEVRPLLEELLRIELQHREHLGELPTATEYERRFDDHVDVVHAAFVAEGISTGPAGGMPSTVSHRPEEPDPEATLTYMCLRPDGRFEPLAGRDDYATLRRTFPPGTVLQGRYVIEHELGRGGMGLVYRGRDQRLGDRPVAIKVILPDPKRSTVGEANVRAAFEEEARLGANLVHPAIATVYDFGLQNGVPFTVFEYIPGETLMGLLRRRGYLSLEDVRLIMGPLAQALDFAHARYVVHRDLKPANIKASEQLNFKILDLGLATEFRRQASWKFCGTPAYASPEQVTGQPCDGRTDQYALACIVYEMLAGQRVFEASGVETLLQMHATAPVVSPRSWVPDLPEFVAATIVRALSKSPEQRFDTCQDFAVAMGVELLSRSRSRSTILREAGVRRASRSFRPELRSYGRRRVVYLALVPEGLWEHQDETASYWPRRTIRGFKARGRLLELRLQSPTKAARLDVEFSNRRQCEEWHRQLEEMELDSKQKALQLTDSSDKPDAASSTQVLLLRRRPGAAYQLLGMVEAIDRKKRFAEASLQIRAALIGADAIVDTQYEHVSTFAKSTWRVTGFALKAVDQEGREELLLRWLMQKVAGSANWMLGAILVHLLLLTFNATLRVASTPHGTFSRWVANALGLFLIHLYPLLVAGLLRWLKWPQLILPSIVALIAIGAWDPVFFLLAWHPLRSAWQAHLRFRTLEKYERQVVPPLRKMIGRVLITASLLLPTMAVCLWLVVLALRLNLAGSSPKVESGQTLPVPLARACYEL